MLVTGKRESQTRNYIRGGGSSDSDMVTRLDSGISGRVEVGRKGDVARRTNGSST